MRYKLSKKIVTGIINQEIKEHQIPVKVLIQEISLINKRSFGIFSSKNNTLTIILPNIIC